MKLTLPARSAFLGTNAPFFGYVAGQTRKRPRPQHKVRCPHARLIFHTAPRPFSIQYSRFAVAYSTARRSCSHGALLARVRAHNKAVTSSVLFCHVLQRRDCDNGLCLTECNTVRGTAPQCGCDYGDALGNRGNEGKQCEVWALMMQWAEATTADEKRVLGSACALLPTVQLFLF